MVALALSATMHAQTMRLSEIYATTSDAHPLKWIYKYRGIRGGVPTNNIISELAPSGHGGEITTALADPILNIIPFDTMYFFESAGRQDFRYVQTFNSNNQPTSRLKERRNPNSAAGYSPDSLYEYRYTSFGKIDTIKAFNITSGTPSECWRAIYTYDLLGRLVEVRFQQLAGQSFQTIKRTSYKFSASVCIEDSTIYSASGNGINRKNVYIYKPGRLDQKVFYLDYNGSWDTARLVKYSYNSTGKKISDSAWNYQSSPTLTGGEFFGGRIYQYHPDGRDDTDTSYVYDSTQPPTFRRVQLTNKITYNTQLLITEVDARHSAGHLGIYKMVFSYEAIKDTVVEVPHIHSIMQVDIYPSPTKSLLYVEASLPAAGNLHATITDITGRTVRQWKEHVKGGYRKQVDVQDLSPGNYFVKLSLGGQCVVKRFAKL